MPALTGASQAKETSGSTVCDRLIEQVKILHRTVREIEDKIYLLFPNSQIEKKAERPQPATPFQVTFLLLDELSERLFVLRDIIQHDL